ncbi:MAG: 23S rRNA (guanosine(2251)-2'-O)-methyltransferase RlmB [Bacteroidia bacterium]|nr:23S rRNA (guanosine(2251)-2'-O)-methyltransferase RlmB [Bacteroidia bacterium]
MENRQPKKKEGLIFGVHPVIEALDSGRQLDRVFVKKGLSVDVLNTISDKARAAGVYYQIVPVDKLDRLCRGGNHQGVAALASMVGYVPLEDLVSSLMDQDEPPCLLLLDGITDIHNFGAIARSAECLGANGVIVAEQGAARVNADAMKISAGALNHLPVCKVQVLADAVLLMKAYGIKIVACTEKGNTSLTQSELTGPVCLMVGAEDKGIQSKLIKLADEHITIPMQGKIGSLNVSVAAGILLMECLRQRKLS